MSLQVWLPLTKDLRQQGLCNIGTINSNAVYSATDGKLGGCYKFTNQTISMAPSTELKNSFNGAASIACWVKVSTSHGAYAQCVTYGTVSTSWTAIFFGIDINGSGVPIGNVANGTSNTNCSFVTAIKDNQWHHLCLTYAAGTMKSYLDGVLKTTTSTSYTPAWTNATIFTIGGNSSEVFKNGDAMNDVRLYNHCLSPMEVKELAKGLVLHYPLNRQGWGQENLFNWSNNATGITLNDYQNVGSFTQFTNSLSFDPSATVGKKYTISFWAKSPNGTTSLLLYNSNSKPKYFNFSTTLTSNLGTEWQFFKYTVTNTQYTGSDASTNTNIWKRIEIYAPSKMKVQVKQIKVEEGEVATPWCPNSSDELATTMGLNSTTEYDCSGFCNNGEKTGTFTYTSDTPKYAVSTTLGNNTTKLHISGLSTTGFANSYSFAWWGKASTFSNMMQWGFSDGIRLNGIYNGTLWNTGDGSNNPLYNPGTTTQVTAPTTNVWHHYVMVGDGTTCKVYKDGILWGQAKTYKAISGTSIYFNGWDSGTSYCHTAGYSMSDFRIYATALSADDVKSLYQNSAYIDSFGNVYGAVHTEV